MKKTYLALIVFVGGSFVGPLLRGITWPLLTSSSEFGRASEDLIYDLVLLLWPAQILAVMEASIGKLGGLLVAVGGNLLLFAIFGAFFMILARRTPGILVASGSLLLCVVLFALWGADFDYSFLNGWALVIALAYYCALLFLAARLTQKGRKSGDMA